MTPSGDLDDRSGSSGRFVNAHLQLLFQTEIGRRIPVTDATDTIECFDTPYVME
jgi:hypothetical protein